MAQSLNLTPRDLALGFIASCLAVLTFHQATVLVLFQLSIIPRFPWNLAPIPPWGVPALASLTFWGGLWGIVYVAVRPLFPRSLPLLAAAFLFGALFPTFFGWFIVAPLKGLPIAGGFVPRAMVLPLIINGMWGLGTALILGWLTRLRPSA